MHYFHNAVSGQMLRYGDMPNPGAQLGPGEAYITKPAVDSPFLYKVNVSTGELEELPPVVPVITWAEIRIMRDRLLSESDWTVLPDTPLDEIEFTDATEYRQALRDITTAFVNPEDVIWPEKPSFIP